MSRATGKRVSNRRVSKTYAFAEMDWCRRIGVSSHAYYKVATQGARDFFDGPHVSHLEQLFPVGYLQSHQLR